MSGLYIGHTRAASLVLRRAVASAAHAPRVSQWRRIAPTEAVALWYDCWGALRRDRRVVLVWRTLLTRVTAVTMKDQTQCIRSALTMNLEYARSKITTPTLLCPEHYEHYARSDVA